MTLPGTWAAPLVLDSETTTPPEGAVLEMVTVPVVDILPGTVAGVILKAVSLLLDGMNSSQEVRALLSLDPPAINTWPLASKVAV